VAITSEGADTAEKFNTSLIKGGKVTFRPGGESERNTCYAQIRKMK
jgi:hypothetical protein